MTCRSRRLYTALFFASKDSARVYSGNYRGSAARLNEGNLAVAHGDCAFAGRRRCSLRRRVVRCREDCSTHHHPFLVSPCVVAVWPIEEVAEPEMQPSIPAPGCPRRRSGRGRSPDRRRSGRAAKLTPTPMPTPRNNRVGLYCARVAVDVARIEEDVEVDRLRNARTKLGGERRVRLAE